MSLAGTRRAVSSEAVKLAGLPSVVLTIVGTIALSVVLAGALALAAPEGIDAVQVVAQAVTFSQAGAILLGVLVVSQEYAGRQIATSLIAVPQRASVLVAKALVYLGVAVIMNAAAVLLSLPAALLVQSLRDNVEPPATVNYEPLPGIIAYLVLMGLLAFGLALVLRSLIAPLVAVLALVMVVSPLLASASEHARWLPDRAGRLIFQPDHDAVLSPWGGGVVIAAWLVIVLGIGASAFVRRDASAS